MAVEQLTVCQWKNPYHLFQSFLKRKAGYNQRKTADELVKAIKALARGPIQIDKGRFATIVQQDYLDFGNNEWVEERTQHFEAMNGMIAGIWKREFNILNLDDRTALEQEINYKYPDGGQKFRKQGHRALRGIWRLVHASALAEDIERHRKPHYIRTAILLVHGFLEDQRSSNNKPCIKAIIIGRTGVWRARAWIEANKLFITAEDYVTNEDQFFIFQVPDFDSNPIAEKRFSNMRGAMMGTALDEKYDGKFPIIATACTAMRSFTSTHFFQANDRRIDASLICQLKKQLPCDYFAPADLLKKLKSENTDATGGDSDAWLQVLLDRKEKVKSPLVILD